MITFLILYTELEASLHLAPLPIAHCTACIVARPPNQRMPSDKCPSHNSIERCAHLNSNPEIWQITLFLPFPNCLLWRLPAVAVRVYFKATSFISLMANWCSNRASNSCRCSKQGRNLVVNIDGTSNQYGPKVNQPLRWLYLFVWAILEHEHYWDF